MKTSLDNKELQLLVKGIFDLRAVESVTGVDWKILAAIWYRENSLSLTPPTRVGGVWQFDPPLTLKKQKDLLNKFTNLSETEKNIIIQNSSLFKNGAILAACFLRNKTKYVLDVREKGDLPDDVVGDTFYTYNGKAYGSGWKNSPYVFNNGDEKHMGMLVKGTLPDTNNPSKRIRIEKQDLRPGAFIIYKQLQRLYPR